MEKEHKEISEYGNFMIEHVSKPAYNVITDVYETFEGFIKMGEEDNIDEEKIQLVSCLHFSDSELWGLFLGTAFYFGFISFVIEDSFTNSELAILNEFLDDPHTNRILNDMERALYVMTEGEIFPKKIFIPQSVRDEIESGRINDTIRQLNSGLKEVDEQEQPVEKNDALPEGEGKPAEQEKYVPHWPTDEELKGYDDIDEDSRFFTNTIFGSPGNVIASDVDKLLNVLISLNIIKDELETKLTFLARYSGKRIPFLELKRIEWKMLDSTNRERALGYLIMKTAGAQYVKGASFFYYEINGERVLPDSREMGPGAHALDLPTRRDTTKIEFEHKFNAFLNEYLSSKRG